MTVRRMGLQEFSLLTASIVALLLSCTWLLKLPASVRERGREKRERGEEIEVFP